MKDMSPRSTFQSCGSSSRGLAVLPDPLLAVDDRLSVLDVDGEGAEPDQRGEQDEQQGRKDNVEAALESVAEERHRTVVRSRGGRLPGGAPGLIVLPVRREQEGIDPAEAPLEDGDVPHVLAEVHDAAVEKMPFLVPVRRQETDDVVAAGDFGGFGQGDGRLARSGHEGRHAAEVAGHGALFPPQRGEDVAGGQQQARREKNVDRNGQEGVDFGRELDKTRYHHHCQDQFFQENEQEEYTEQMGVETPHLHLPETGNGAADE